MKRAAIFLLALATMMSSWAQGSQARPKIVGKLQDVKPLVTVFVGDQAVSAFNGNALVVGTRIVTSSVGEVTLKFDVGCDIKLKPNEQIVVEDTTNCVAAIVPVPPPVVAATAAAAAAGAGIGVGAGLVLGGAAIIGIVVGNDKNNNSPN